MDFSLSLAQKTLVARAHDDADTFATSPEEAGFCGSASWVNATRNGWAALCLSTDLGGGGFSALDSVLAFEALGRSGADRGALFAMGAHLFGCAKGVELFASASRKALWAPKLAGGMVAGALAFTESSGGSELGCGETTLRRDGDGWVLNGRKTFVTNGINAGVYLVLARDPLAKPPLDLSVVLVPADNAQVRATPLNSGVGLAGSGMAEVEFDECKIDPEDILGRQNGGLGVVLTIMKWERSCILAGALGALERDFRHVTGALSQRKDARGPLIAHQAVAHRLANLRQKIEAARLILFRSAWELDQGGDEILYPALSKLTVSAALLEGAVELQTLMAGAGWANEFKLGDAVQDAIAMNAASGTADIQRNLIAKRLLL